MEWNAETVLDALNDFERKPEIPEVLDQYLERIAKNGEIVFPWGKLKPLLKKKLEVVLDEFYESCPVETSVPVPNFETFNFDSLKKTILQAVESFTSAPFTIQRLCELVTNPTKHYNRTDKYMRGIEKNVLVVSTLEPRSAQADSANANNPVVNGLPNDSPRDDNDALNGHESSDSVSSSNTNASTNHVLLENFANVFPSAACIPPSSNICIEQEIDSNFIEAPDTDEPQFEAISSAEPIESLEAKEEVMDIVEDEHEQPHNSTSESENSSTDIENQLTKDIDLPEVSSKSDSDLSDISLDSTTNSSSESIEDNVSGTETQSDQHEADCCELTLTSEEDSTIKMSDCQQDDTVSQSDDDSHNSTEQSHSDNSEVKMPCEEIVVETNMVENKESLNVDSNDAPGESLCNDSPGESLCNDSL